VVGVLLALFACPCSTLCSANLLGGLLDSAARRTVTSIGLFGSTVRSTTLATPPCIRFGIRHQNRAERGTLETSITDFQAKIKRAISFTVRNGVYLPLSGCYPQHRAAFSGIQNSSNSELSGVLAVEPKAVHTNSVLLFPLRLFQLVSGLRFLVPRL